MFGLCSAPFVQLSDTPWQQPPPRPYCRYPPPPPARRHANPPTPQATCPNPPSPPRQVLTDSGGLGRIRSGCSRPPMIQMLICGFVSESSACLCAEGVQSEAYWGLGSGRIHTSKTLCIALVYVPVRLLAGQSFVRLSPHTFWWHHPGSGTMPVGGSYHWGFMQDTTRAVL